MEDSLSSAVRHHLQDLCDVRAKLREAGPHFMGGAFTIIDVEVGHLLEHYCIEHGLAHTDKHGKTLPLPQLLDRVAEDAKLPPDLVRALKDRHATRSSYVHQRSKTPRPDAEDAGGYLDAVTKMVACLYGERASRYIDG